MQVESIINGGISIILIPSNTMEEELLKELMKQELSIDEFRSSITVLNRNFSNGIIIQKRSSADKDKKKEDTVESKTEKSAIKKEAV